MTKNSNLICLTAKKLHILGEDLREQDRHEEAIEYLSLAIVKYQKSKNYSDMIDALKGRCLTWKHYFLLTNDRVFAILALKDAEAMLNIAQEKKLADKISTSYFRLGEVAMLTENLPLAINYFKHSLKHYVGPKSEKGDYKYHLGEALYRNGDKKEGKKTILQGLKEIQENSKEVDPFLIHVWETGAHMRLAFCLRKDEPGVAQFHLKEAKNIVQNDKKLVIRKRQIQDLAKILKTTK